MTSVIVVDDDVDSVYIISEYLKLKGYSVVGSGTNGKEAFELYTEREPDLLILDMKMPEYDGIYAIDNIKKVFPDAKIIVITAYRDNYDFSNHKVSAVLQKPYHVSELLKKIKEVIPWVEELPLC